MQTLEEKDERIEKQVETIRELRDEITQLQGEKRDLTDALNLTSRKMEYYRADYVRRPNMRTDQNWDSRPRVERSDESHIEIAEQGLYAINGEDPNKQVKFSHDDGESTLIVTDDNWESSETLYRG